MKKTYINPKMEIVKIASQTQMLAGSKVSMGSGNASEWGARENDFDDFDDLGDEEDF